MIISSYDRNDVKRTRKALLKELVSMCKHDTMENPIIEDDGRHFTIKPAESNLKTIYDIKEAVLFAAYNDMSIYVTMEDGVPCIVIY